MVFYRTISFWTYLVSRDLLSVPNKKTILFALLSKLSSEFLILNRAGKHLWYPFPPVQRGMVKYEIFLISTGVKHLLNLQQKFAQVQCYGSILRLALCCWPASSVRRPKSHFLRKIFILIHLATAESLLDNLTFWLSVGLYFNKISLYVPRTNVRGKHSDQIDPIQNNGGSKLLLY